MNKLFSDEGFSTAQCFELLLPEDLEDMPLTKAGQFYEAFTLVHYNFGYSRQETATKSNH